MKPTGAMLVGFLFCLGAEKSKLAWILILDIVNLI